MALAGLAVTAGLFYLVHSRRSVHLPTLPPPAPLTGTGTSRPQAETPQLPQTLAQIQEEERAVGRRLVQTFPREAGARILLADILARHGRLTEAVTSYRRALALDAGQADGYRKLGQVLRDRGDPNGAAATWRQALEQDPNLPGLRWELARIALEGGRAQEAVGLLDEACRRDPQAARNHYLRAQAYQELERFEEARADYERALELDPGSYNALYGLGLTYRALGDPNRARDTLARYQRARAQRDAQPENRVPVDEVPAARQALARTYVRAAGLLRQARQMQAVTTLLERAVALDPTALAPLEALGVHYYGLHRFDDALRVYRRAQSLDPNSPRFALNCGKVLIAQQHLAEAEAVFATAIRRFPEDGHGALELAELYLRAERNPGQALDLARRAEALLPSHRSHFVRAWAEDVGGHTQAALEAIRRARALAPDNANYRTLEQTLSAKAANNAP